LSEKDTEFNAPDDVAEQQPLSKREIEDKKLEYLAEIEKTFYPEGLEQFLRFDRGTEPITELMRYVWKTVREIILPRISYYYVAEGLKDTEWDMVTMRTGGGKTTTSSYLVFHYLHNLKWIQQVVSTTPIFAGDPFDYPFPLRDNNGKRMLHPKLNMLRYLRDIDQFHDCIFFFDEVGSLVPGRNFADRRQWWCATVAKNARRRNIMVVMNEQHPKNLDVLLRENVAKVIEPMLNRDLEILQFKVYENYDADFSAYFSKTQLGFGPDPMVYPNWESDVFEITELPWFFGFFDTRHEVPPLFQQIMTDKKLQDETDSLERFIKDTNPGGIFANYTREDGVCDPPKPELWDAIELWNKQFEKLYVGDELLQIFMEYRKRHHVVPVKEEKEDKEPLPRIIARRILENPDRYFDPKKKKITPKMVVKREGCIDLIARNAVTIYEGMVENIKE